MNELIIRIIIKPVTPAMVLPSVHDFNVWVMVSPANLDTTQNPESFGNERHKPPSEMDIAVSSGDTSV